MTTVLFIIGVSKLLLTSDPCHQPIYPPGYKPMCRLLMNQWTYDAQSGQCVEFEYYPCGEDRDGYDVFATKEECVNTCQNQLRYVMIIQCTLHNLLSPGHLLHCVLNSSSILLTKTPWNGNWEWA